MADKEISIELRLVAAFALSFVILLGSRYVLTKYAPPPQSKPPVKQATAPASAPGDASSAPSSPADTASAPPPAEGTKVGSADQQITVESENYRVVFSTKGAVVKNWFLKGYLDEKKNALDLVDQVAAQEFGDPLSIWTADPALRDKLNGSLFVASPASSNSVQAPAPDDQRFGAWARTLAKGSRAEFELDPRFTESIAGRNVVLRAIYLDRGTGAFTIRAAGRRFTQALAGSSRWRTAEFKLTASALTQVAVEGDTEITLHMIEVAVPTR